MKDVLEAVHQEIHVDVLLCRSEPDSCKEKCSDHDRIQWRYAGLASQRGSSTCILLSDTVEGLTT
jgi:hypothetical protein